MKYVLIDLIYESYKNRTTMCMQPVLNVYKQKTMLLGGLLLKSYPLGGAISAAEVSYDHSGC